MSGSKAKILVVIVTYNAEKWIRECIESILAQSVPADIYVVDNQSTDPTREILSEYEGLILDFQSENLGFGKANNKGLQYALDHDYDHAYLLNQDAYMAGDCLEKSLRALEVYQGNAGIIASMQLNGTGTEMDFRFQNYLHARSCPDFLSDSYLGKVKEAYKCNFANAAAWLLPRNTLETVGFFDPIFFLYGEDSSYLDRLKSKQLDLVLAPDSVVRHDREERKGKRNFAKFKNQVKAEHLVTSLSLQLSPGRRWRQFTMYTLSLVKGGNPRAAIYGVFLVLGIWFKARARRRLYRQSAPRFTE